MWTSHVQVLRVRVWSKKKKERHGKSRANGTRTIGAVRPGQYSNSRVVSRGCNNATSAARRILPCQTCRAKRLAVGHRHPRWRRSRDSQVQSHNWSNVSCTLVTSTRVITNKLCLVWQKIDVAFENRIVTSVVINSNHQHRVAVVFRRR